MPAAIFAAISGCFSRVVPLRRRVRRPHRLGHQHLAPAGRGRPEHLDVARA